MVQKIVVPLQRVFHSIRFKVNKVLGEQRLPNFFVPTPKDMNKKTIKNEIEKALK